MELTEPAAGKKKPAPLAGERGQIRKLQMKLYAQTAAVSSRLHDIRYQHVREKVFRTPIQWQAQRRAHELHRLYASRYPNGLPHNRLGVRYARYMCRTMAFDPIDRREQWLERHAPWLKGTKERADILSLGPYWYAPTSLAEHLELYDDERDDLDIRTIAAVDVTPEQRKEINREKDKKRKERERRKTGAKPRAQYLAASLSRTQPWKAEGISRSTWERRRRKAGDASPSVSSAHQARGLCRACQTGQGNAGELPERRRPVVSARR
jgi:hypothetical protein